jgi:hypothetical protein
MPGDLEAAAREAQREGGPVAAGQNCGLIHELPPAAEVERRMVAEAEAIVGRLPTYAVGAAVAGP